MNRNRRNNRNRQQNRRPPPNRTAPQNNRDNQPPISQQQCEQSEALAQQNSPTTSTSGLSQQQQQLQQSPYSRTYYHQSQSQQQPSTRYGANSQQFFETPGQRFQQPYAVPPQQPQMGLHVPYVPSSLDREADNLYSDVHCSLMRAIDSSYAMPISEHVFYSSYESYDNIMMEQRRQLNEMMSQLTECSERPLAPQYYTNVQSVPLAENVQHQTRRTDFGNMDDMQDKYDSIHEFSEQIYDRIGHNLDDAAGLTMRNAQLVQATLEAANHNRLAPIPSHPTSAPLTAYPTHNQYQQVLQQTNLSSSSSSSSLTNRPSETSSPASYTYNQQQQQQQQQHLQSGEVEYQAPPSARLQPRTSNYQDATYSRPQANIIQPMAMQNQYQQRNQSGVYMGKQQYGSSYYQRSFRENKNIPRPQDSFKDEIDNSYKPFKPLIKEKPNAIVPLNITLDHDTDDHGNEHYSHPYETEINQFYISEDFLNYREPIRPTDINTSVIVLVENVEQLEEMCETIEQEKEIAVDLEHHSYRSYQGITCLLQISTRAQDFVIDTIKLRSELQRLNRSFTNPNIVKVFHGADCDILWLQRDFGVYVVNLFDTSRAANLMKFAHLSLAFLMKHYCNAEIDKSYQLADWRERPLPLPMIQYARADTHYLLYIYDRLRNDLLMRDKSNKEFGRELLRSVFNRGNEICLKRYKKPPHSDKSHLSVLKKSKSTFNAKQMYAFKEMYKWRDRISRELDESVGYVLPNNLMIRIAEYLPREPQGITALCNPVPPTLKKYLNDVHGIILKALEIPLDEASKVMSDGNPLNIDPSLRSIDLDSINHKQDIAHSAGLQEGEVHGILDMLYQLNCDDSSANNEQRTNSRHTQSYHQYANQQNLREYSNYVNNLNQNPSRLYNFLGSTPNGSNQEGVRNVHQSIRRQFVSPYSRYEARNK